MKSLLLARAAIHYRSHTAYKILRARSFSTSSSSKSPAPVDTLYSRISRVEHPTISVVPVIEKWLEEGKDVKQSELLIFIKLLRKYRRSNHALQISEWMTDQGGYNLSPGDVAIRLDLISKVQGLVKAEEYFNSIPDAQRALQIYGALLNCYARYKALGKAEAIMQKMKDLGILKASLSYNVMLKLYSQMGQYEKLDHLMQEMEENGIDCDMFTYNIRLNAYAVSSDIERMEKLLMKMEVDPLISMHFHPYVAAANGYLKAGLVDKALVMLKRSEQLIKGDSRRLGYEMLLSLYAASGNKAEVYNIWNKYKKIGRFFNSGYLCMLSSLLKLEDIDGAEKIWEEWNSGKKLFDVRVPDLMIDAYSRHGLCEKAEACLKKIAENGKEPGATAWNNLAAGYIVDGQKAKAVKAMKKAISISKVGWKPRLSTLSVCLEYLKEQGELETVEELLQRVKEHCGISGDAYDKLSNPCWEEDDVQNFVEETPTGSE